MSPKSLFPSLIAAVLAVGTIRLAPHTFNGIELEPTPAAKITTARAEVSPALPGRVTLLTFGYARCPDICPTTLARARVVREKLGKQAAFVHFAFVSIDPARDTQAELELFVDRFGARIEAFVPSADGLAAMLDAYGLIVRRRPLADPTAPPDDYDLDHTSGFLVVDRAGLVRLREPLTLTAEQIADDVRRVLDG